MDDVADPVLLSVDRRKRISLGNLANHDQYLVTVESDGTIVLTPAVVMTVAQAQLLQRPVTAANIDAFLADPEIGSRRQRRTI